MSSSRFVFVCHHFKLNQPREGKTPDRMEVDDEVKLKWEFNEFIRKRAITNFLHKIFDFKNLLIIVIGPDFSIKARQTPRIIKSN